MSAGYASWLSGFLAMFLVPIAGIILGLFGAAIARRRRYLIALCSVTSINLPWVVAASSRGVGELHPEWLGLLELVGLFWALPLGIVFYVLWHSRSDLAD